MRNRTGQGERSFSLAPVTPPYSLLDLLSLSLSMGGRVFFFFNLYDCREMGLCLVERVLHGDGETKPINSVVSHKKKKKKKENLVVRLGEWWTWSNPLAPRRHHCSAPYTHSLGFPHPPHSAGARPRSYCPFFLPSFSSFSLA